MALTPTRRSMREMCHASTTSQNRLNFEMPSAQYLSFLNIHICDTVLNSGDKQGIETKASNRSSTPELGEWSRPTGTGAVPSVTAAVLRARGRGQHTHRAGGRVARRAQELRLPLIEVVPKTQQMI